MENTSIDRRLARSSARLAHAEFYETGIACKYGHTVKRRTFDGQCMACLAERHRRPETMAKIQRWRESHPGYSAMMARRWRLGVKSTPRIKLDPEGRNKPTTAPKPSTPEARTKRREKARKYKARKRAGGKNYTEADVVWLRAKQGGKCAICLLKIGAVSWEVDHRISLANGGTNDRPNLQVSHMLCNRSKGKRHEIDYAQERFGRLL